MGRVKEWLMEMQECADHLIGQINDKEINITQAREKFVAKHGLTQITIFNDKLLDDALGREAY